MTGTGTVKLSPHVRKTRDVRLIEDSCASNVAITVVIDPETAMCTIERSQDHVYETEMTQLNDVMIEGLRMSAGELIETNDYLEDRDNLDDFFDLYDEDMEFA